MKSYLVFVPTFAALFAAALDAFSVAVSLNDTSSNVERLFKFRTTADRISAHGYKVEEHVIQTIDGYILKIFRITNTPKNNCSRSGKPVVFLQHGLTCSSDTWILNGPNNALAYLLANRCYDVWIGNARGNVYSKKNAYILPLLPRFWAFSWNEIGLYDLPAMIDYALDKTGQKKLNYVGHSQGTTVFLVMLSQSPRYNDKISTSHMLAPIFYMNHLKSPLFKALAPIAGYPSLLDFIVGNTEFMPSTRLMSLIGAAACHDKSIFQSICRNVLFLIAGWDSKHLNYTLIPEVMDTHPAGASTNQLIHYFQEYESGHFRKFDYGIFNLAYYGSVSPPDYPLENIRQKVPIQFFYSDNDNFASVKDVERMAKKLGENVKLNHIRYSDWNHLDFVWALDVKDVINDKIIALIDAYEKKS